MDATDNIWNCSRFSTITMKSRSKIKPKPSKTSLEEN
jgi:hypothetical protein